mmetsp:Transcript_43246/g.92516  ORF Transcript_43246/g.92516 Transcript_43246/m.92516 type:complete len:254 (-) Transcript_43246:281-1042(-)
MCIFDHHLERSYFGAVRCEIEPTTGDHRRQSLGAVLAHDLHRARAYAAPAQQLRCHGEDEAQAGLPRKFVSHGLFHLPDRSSAGFDHQDHSLPRKEGCHMPTHGFRGAGGRSGLGHVRLLDATSAQRRERLQQHGALFPHLLLLPCPRPLRRAPEFVRQRRHCGGALHPEGPRHRPLQRGSVRLHRRGEVLDPLLALRDALRPHPPWPKGGGPREDVSEDLHHAKHLDHRWSPLRCGGQRPLSLDHMFPDGAS